jgi:hypothetical protein
MFAAVRSTSTQTISVLSLLVFHAVMLAITVRVFGRGPRSFGDAHARLAIAYVPFYVIDAALISRSLPSCIHPSRALHRRLSADRVGARAERLAGGCSRRRSSSSPACGHTTHAILPFVISSASFCCASSCISHDESLDGRARRCAGAAVDRAAWFYVFVALAIGAFLFPLLPRVRNPLLPGPPGRWSNGHDRPQRLDQSQRAVRLAATPPWSAGSGWGETIRSHAAAEGDHLRAVREQHLAAGRRDFAGGQQRRHRPWPVRRFTRTGQRPTAVPGGKPPVPFRWDLRGERRGPTRRRADARHLLGLAILRNTIAYDVAMAHSTRRCRSGSRCRTIP